MGYILNNGLDVLVYSGDKDFICNWYGGRAWTNAVEWDHKKEFNDAQFEKWAVNGKPAGEVKRVKNFKFLRVYDAGHMVPMNQPDVALAMLNTFMTGKTEMEHATF